MNKLPGQNENKERMLLVAEVKNYTEKNDFTFIQVIITRSKFIMASGETIIRDIPIHKIEAITISKISDEFIIHVHNNTDERFASKQHKDDLIKMMLYLLTYRHPIHKFMKTKLYFVDNSSLDFYVTNSEDLEDGHLIRPDKKDIFQMDYQDYTKLEEIKRQKRIAELPGFQPKTKSKVGMNLCDFKFIKTLGKGSHGKVLLATHLSNPDEQYAIKILKKSEVIKSKQLEHTITEKQILSTFSHPFLVNLKDVFHTETKIYFVMEFLKGGELFQHLKRVVRFKEDQAKFFCASVVCAIGHLHNADYIYRDLKPENILLDETGYPKITDFGLAKYLKVSSLADTYCGTPEYMAPEVILKKGCNRAADWWSLGILAYEMLFGAPPFYTQDVAEMQKRTLLQELKFPTKKNVSRACLDFIAGLLMKIPSKRLGSIGDVLEVKNHPWFAGFEWEKLELKQLEAPFKPQNVNWEANFDPDFIKEEPRDSICQKDDMNLEEFKSDFDKFTNQKSEISDFDLNFITNPVLNVGFINDLLFKVAKNQEPKAKNCNDFDEYADDKEDGLPITEEEIDKENPNKKTPLRSKNMTPKQPFKVIYSSPKITEFDISDISRGEEKKPPKEKEKFKSHL